MAHKKVRELPQRSRFERPAPRCQALRRRVGPGREHPGPPGRNGDSPRRERRDRDATSRCSRSRPARSSSRARARAPCAASCPKRPRLAERARARNRAHPGQAAGGVTDSPCSSSTRRASTFGPAKAATARSLFAARSSCPRAGPRAATAAMAAAWSWSSTAAVDAARLPLPQGIPRRRRDEPGANKDKYGRGGEDLILRVPPRHADLRRHDRRPPRRSAPRRRALRGRARRQRRPRQHPLRHADRPARPGAPSRARPARSAICASSSSCSPTSVCSAFPTSASRR